MELKDIEDLYIKYGPMVLRRCRFLLKNEDRAMDAMQEVFVKLLTGKNLTSEFPSALLYRIATNVCLNIIKADKKSPNQDTLAPDDLVYQIADKNNFVDKIISRDLIERIFKSEPVSTKGIAITHYVDGFTLAQTAREYGLSISGVRKRLRKLRKNILNQNNMGIHHE